MPTFSGSPAPTPRAERTVPRLCHEVVQGEEVESIIGNGVSGVPAAVVGVPEPAIGRTTRIDCYYGVPTGAPSTAATLTITLAGYTDAATAAYRVGYTMDGERAKGGQVVAARAGLDPATPVFAGKSTLIAAHGRTTVVVEAAPELVPPDRAADLLGRIADRALTPR